LKLELKVPAVGESITTGMIARWMRKDGETVRKGEMLFELETEKASMDVPSTADGRLQILVIAGSEVAIGQVVATIDGDAATEAPASAAASAPAAVPPAPAAAVAAPAAAPLASAGAVPGITRTPLSMTRRTIARRLVQARQESAHLTTFNEVDMTEVIRIRKDYGEDFAEKYQVKLGFMSFFVVAAAKALREYPVLNGRIEGDELLSPDFVDMGVAVSAERGLLVPVLRNADALGFGEIESRLGDLAARARDGKIALSELQGGTFTITNGGVFGSMLSTPIPNYPQSAILGMHAIQRRPIAVGEEVRIRPMMYLALTYDHRLIDGKDAVQFLVRIKERIENPERLIFGL
jgi:2-oxoglutarate dehydrogenase E2 component (dihydrolipoamide succinyltransferase)